MALEVLTQILPFSAPSAKSIKGQGEEELEQSVSIIKIPGHVVSQEFLRNMRMKGPLSQKEIFL